MRFARVLRRAGVRYIFGVGLDGVAVREVPDDLAPMFASADAAVGAGVSVAHLGGGAFVITVAGTDPVHVAGVEAAIDALETVRLSVCGVTGAAEVARVADAVCPVVLAGSGVVRAQAAADVRLLATQASVGVLNTFSVKGLFDWQSPHHLGTAGLQALDFELGGLAEADVIIAIGVDPGEARLRPPIADRTIAVEPNAAAALARRWRRHAIPITRPPLYTRLAEVVQRAWHEERVPVPPARLTRDYAAALGRSGFVAADSGLAGFWVARTFPTSKLGSVHVPVRKVAPGYAIAACVAARLRSPARSVLAVTDGPVEAIAPVLDAARRLGAAVSVVRWSWTGDDPDAVHVDPDDLAALVEVAGPIVAWT
jgi:hypothetical protein